MAKFMKRAGEKVNSFDPLDQDVPDMVTEFQPGDNGITLSGTVVVKVKEGSQAQAAGVKPGWRICGLASLGRAQHECSWWSW